MPATTLARFQRITPQQLRAFEASARLLSVTRAAQELCVSQPTVSVQLRELASTLGEPLFQQCGRSIQLTQAGEALFVTVRELAGCWQRLESRLAEIHGLVRGRLKLAAVTTAEYFVPDLLGSFAAAHPGVDIELAIENRDRVVGRLSQGQDELVVMMMPPDNLPLEQLEFQTNPLVVIAPSSHPKAHQPITLKDLAEERWLMREPGSGTRMATEQHFHQQGFVPSVAMSLGSNEAIKHAVAAGLGIAVLSRLAICPPLWPVVAASAAEPGSAEPLTMLQVEGFPLNRHWYVVWRSDLPLSAAARHFLHYLQSGS
ncbi:LysR substrate-binding domain-containing protein [Alkalimonas sp.]|uniref:LysR substrate-binding domain-containing protein n=1 Tax=Alkalimonas sp. TaxID=1872453 RepID=UPI00263BB852|nr:LysR substrate-binding domain-containing protein [Alkalimonas sp.]MCC5827595.1 LysR family transcriptional regulator [Alkalimonas sp.]